MVKRRYFLVSVSCVLCALVFVLSMVRIQHVNDALKIDENAESKVTNIKDPDTVDETYGLLEPIDISLVESHKKIAPQGVSCFFSNPRIIELKDLISIYPDWLPHLSSDSSKKSDDPKYLLVDMTIDNNSSEDSPILWFNAQAGSWSQPNDPPSTKLLNNMNDEDQFLARSGESVTYVVSYQLWEPVFSPEQWERVDVLDYSLTLIDYPRKIIVALEEVKAS